MSNIPDRSIFLRTGYREANRFPNLYGIIVLNSYIRSKLNFQYEKPLCHTDDRGRRSDGNSCNFRNIKKIKLIII